jgi:2-haloacid dehalogenase
VNRARGLDIEWAALLSKWRDLYRMALDQVIIGQRPWIRVDSVYREALEAFLERRVLSGVFTTAKRDELNQVWTRLDPWPDSMEGFVTVIDVTKLKVLGGPPENAPRSGRCA